MNEQFFSLPHNEGSEIQRLKRDFDALQEQIRELKDTSTKETKSLTEQLKELNKAVFQNVPPIINHIDNGDFTFNQEQYVAGTNYAGDQDDAAMWYTRDSTSTGQVTEHTTTVQSGDKYTHAASGANANHWFKTNGEAWWGGRNALFSPLPKNIAFPAATVFCRFQIKKRTSGVSIPDSWRLRAAIWDNTSGQQKIVEGAVFDLDVDPAQVAPGSFTRKYILRVDTNMDFFFSDVISPSQATNQVSVTNVDNNNFVEVSWQVFPESVRYRLFRHDSEFNEWRQIADIFNGATSFKDVGGREGALFIAPVANLLPRAQALFVNFGEYVTDQYKDVIFNIFIPSNYNYALTTNKQWLRIDMVDENLDFVTLPSEALLIDKVGVGYNNGRFTYSARDLAANASIQATTPPPTPVPGGPDGGGGGVPPNPGEGDGPENLVLLLV